MSRGDVTLSPEAWRQLHEFVREHAPDTPIDQTTSNLVIEGIKTLRNRQQLSDSGFSMPLTDGFLPILGGDNPEMVSEVREGGARR